MTINEAKDQAAREYGYRDYNTIFTSYEIGEVPKQSFENFTNRALEIYGNAQWNAAIEKAAESAELRTKIKIECTNEELEKGYSTTGQLAIIVKKESILKLKKP